MAIYSQNCFKNTDVRIVLLKGEVYGESVLLGIFYAHNIYVEEYFGFIL